MSQGGSQLSVVRGASGNASLIDKVRAQCGTEGDALEFLHRHPFPKSIANRTQLIAEWRLVATYASLLKVWGRRGRLQLVLMGRYRQLLAHPCWEGDQLVQALRVYCEALLGVEAMHWRPVAYPDGALAIEYTCHRTGGWAVDPIEHCEVTALWLILAEFFADAQAWRRACRSAAWALGYLERAEGCPVPFLSTAAVWQGGELSWRLGLLRAWLLNGAWDVTASLYSQALFLAGVLYIKRPMDARATEETSFAGGWQLRGDSACGAHLSLCSAGAGLGVAWWSELELRAFGPSLGRLGDMAGFGIMATPDEAAQGRVALLSREQRARAAPSSFVTEEIRKQPYWLDVDLGWGDEGLRIGAAPLWDPNWPDGLWMNFLWSAERLELLVDGDLREVGPVQGYDGAAVKVLLEGSGGACVALQSELPLPMSVRRLASDRGFWGADFLVAFSLSSAIGQNLTWSIHG